MKRFIEKVAKYQHIGTTCRKAKGDYGDWGKDYKSSPSKW
jgi:hypothetical protein